MFLVSQAKNLSHSYLLFFSHTLPPIWLLPSKHILTPNVTVSAAATRAKPPLFLVSIM